MPPPHDEMAPPPVPEPEVVHVEPVRERIVVVKSSVHFRADFQPIAREVLVVTAPGPALADPVDFAWKKLRRGVRLRPNGPVYSPAA